MYLLLAQGMGFAGLVLNLLAYQCRNSRRLILTHTYEPKRTGAIEEAKKRLAIPVEWAMPETVIEY